MESREMVVIYVDADACPVQAEIVEVAQTLQQHVIFVKSYAHFSSNDVMINADVIYVDKGKEVADMKIVSLVRKGDFVITQDYGLASLCIQKGCIVLHHKGFQYTPNNIERLLMQRHMQVQARRACKRTKGPKRYTEEEKDKFVQLLTALIKKHSNAT